MAEFVIDRRAKIIIITAILASLLEIIDTSIVNVARSPWSSPFRIQPGPDNPGGPCTIVWATRGSGPLRRCPDGFEPIMCESPRVAQELVVAGGAEEVVKRRLAMA